jgi:hypothetical protein
MKNPNVYELFIEGRIGDNIKKTKRLFNSVLEEVKDDKELFESQFLVINEDHNIDCADVKTGFVTVSKQLKEAKSLIEEAAKQKKKSNLKKAQEIIRKAHKKLKEAERAKEQTIDSFHSVVNIAEGLEREKTI